MRIEFLREWGVYPVGRVVDFPHDGGAENLIARGIARIADVTATGLPPTAAAVPAKASRAKRERH